MARARRGAGGVAGAARKGVGGNGGLPDPTGGGCGTGGAPSLQITTPDNRFTVLGNITSNPIKVNGQNLAAPWTPLNVQA